jgi:hypothetical protein
MSTLGPAPEYHDYEPAQSEAPSTPGSEGIQYKIVLRDQDADTYLEALRKLIRGGKLNQFYPNPTAQENLYRLMSPSGNEGIDPEIRLNPRCGLPSEPDMGRVVADKDTCDRFLQRNDTPDVMARSDEASYKLHRRIRYLRDVARSELPRRVKLELKLRRVDQVSKTASFYSIFERYDPGEGVFTRYTITLQHQDTRWNRNQVELQGDDLKATEAFRNVISRYHSDEAEFAFILLSQVPGIKVEEVVRGRIGPLWFKEAETVPDEVRRILEQHPGNFILNFPLERVVINSSAKEDLLTDPFARFYRNTVEGEARQYALEQAERLGYRVFKERKFCVTRGIAKPFQDLLAERKARCIIYTI